MKRDGYESDKNDIVIKSNAGILNLTEAWDGTVNGFMWGQNEDLIYFTAAIDGTVQLFSIGVDTKIVRQITRGDFDITSIVGEVEGNINCDPHRHESCH